MYFDARLWQFTVGVRWRLALAVAVGLAAACVGIVRLALLGWLLAKVLVGEPLASLTGPILAVALTMGLRGVLEYWRNMLAHETASRVQLTLRELLYEKIVALGPAHFGLKRTGDALLSMVEGVEQLEVYFGQYLPQLFVALLVPIAVFAFVAFLDLPVALVMLAFALLTLFAPAVFHSWDSDNAKQRQRAYEEFGAEFLDALQGLATLQAFGQSGARGAFLADKAHQLFERTMWVLATNTLTRGITDTGIAMGAAGMLVLGAYRVDAGTMSLEALLMILIMGIEVFRPLRDLRALLHQGMLGRSAAEGIMSLLQSTPSIPADAQASEAGSRAPTIAFEEVEFSYPGAKRPAHRKLSFEVREGEKVGIVGSSGCGKSSVVKLLLRLYDPDAGTVRLGGHDIRTLSPELVRRHIAVVHQDTYLFHGTVADNLRFGKPDANGEELVRAATIANAHEFVAKLPQGYDTVVGERGIRLSGGQRQRIAIARAILRDAPILVLDEALSSVDAENEAIIQEALERVMEGRTTLIFAHRLSSVINADRLLVLDEGRVVESGRHAELMAADGIYARLMRAQIEVDEAAPGERVAEARFALDRPDEADAVARETQYLEPTDAILRAEGMGWLDTIRVLFRMIVPWKTKLVLTFLFGVARVSALIGVGVVSALVVAAVKNGTEFGHLVWILAIIAPLAGILHWVESWIAHDMAFRLLAELRVALFKKLDALGPAYLVRRRTGDLVATATHDVELVEYFFAHTVAPAFVAVLVPCAVLSTLAMHGWPMAACLVPFLLIVALSPLLLRRRLDELGSRAREASGNLNAHAVDTIQGLSEIIAFDHAEHRRREFVQRTLDFFAVRLPFFRDLSVHTAILEVCTGLGGLAVVVTGAYLVTQGSLDTAVLPLLTLLAMAAFLPVSEIAHIGRQLADTLGATRRLYAIHDEEIVVRDGPGAQPSGANAASVEMDEVTFTYHGRVRPALDDVSFSVPAGKTVAIVGPSGAGKTTAAHLLMRFWDPQAGSVELGGTTLREFKLEDLRDQIALVTQDTYLFNTDLRANITIAKPEASDAEIHEAIDKAALSDFVASLPDGLATPVGERGVRLSGGQRQRVAIARAFLKDAPILILDEATSHLDAVNERLVHEALEDLMHDRTTVVIAHRLSTVRNADQLVVMENGRVSEHGTHDELLAANGLYSQLISRQLTSVASAAG